MIWDSKIPSRALLGLLPLATIILLQLTSRFSLHVLEFPDPDFGYLFNSLSILRGATPWHVDHPGTPLQLLGAALLKLRYILSGTAPDLVADFLAQPLAYHQALLALNAVILAAAQLWCGLRLYAKSLPISGCLFAQLSPYLVWDGVVYLDHTSPETLLSAAGLLLVGVFCREEERHPFAAGIVLALLCALKASALPLLFCLLLLRERKQIALGILAFIVGFLGFTAPIWPNYPRMFGWFITLAKGGGPYGQVSSQSIVDGLIANKANPWLMQSVAPLLLVLAFAILWRLVEFFFSRGGHKYLRDWPLWAGGALLLVLMLRHPASRYFLVLVPAVALLVLRKQGSGIRNRSGPFVWSILWITIFYPALFSYQLQLRYRAGNTIAQLNEALNERYPECHVLVIDDVGIPAFALFSGNLATEGEAFAPELKKQHPRFSFRQANIPRFRTYGGLLDDKDWARQALGAPCFAAVGRQDRALKTFAEIFHEAPRILEGVGEHNYFYIMGLPLQVERRLVNSLRN